MKSLRACGCVVTAGRSCPSHPPRRRPSTAARGYGAAHQRARAAGLEAAYGQTCTRCREPMVRGERLDLDHTDDRASYRGFSHAACNRRAGGRASRGS